MEIASLVVFLSRVKFSGILLARWFGLRCVSAFGILVVFVFLVLWGGFVMLSISGCLVCLVLLGLVVLLNYCWKF